MESKDLPGIKGQTFKLTLPKDRYIMGFDSYDEELTSNSIGVVSNPIQQFGIKRIRGFKRVVSIGWSYVVEFIK